MNRFIPAAGLVIACSSLALAASPAVAATEAARSKACWQQADVKGLKGGERTTFHATCLQGALAPSSPTPSRSGSKSAQVLLAPSGSDRTTRSRQCAEEARRKSSDENQQKSIRLSCLASAAPASATGTPTHPPTPTHAKPGYDELPR